MVLQNKHKQRASAAYKRAHSIPTHSTTTASSDVATHPPRETHQERQLRLGSNHDRYLESSSDDDLDPEQTQEGQEVDEHLVAHKRQEQAELDAFLEKQHALLSRDEPSTSRGDPDDDDIDDSFKHLRLSNKSKKGQVMRDSGDRETSRELEREAKRAQAVRDLKDRFAIPAPRPSPPPPPISASYSPRFVPSASSSVSRRIPATAASSSTTTTTKPLPFGAEPSRALGSTSTSSKPATRGVNAVGGRVVPPLPTAGGQGAPGQDDQDAAGRGKRGGEDFLDSLL
ncbi:hypothetical protein JCM10212_005352 [Sporobolomyces blumeae]